MDTHGLDDSSDCFISSLETDSSDCSKDSDTIPQKLRRVLRESLQVRTTVRVYNALHLPRNLLLEDYLQIP
ncbi:hypothetical protein K0M31_004337 [Melipona bicolor]|uniref:Uncharacterized protein n=1 Tax=Melipona bicolor TaxID=60889 RepID=A0AA40FWK9_9HYME|nr:hypothetical protein K0M31_004337 [Melipona bicolor]